MSLQFNIAYTLQADTLDVLSDLREVRRVMDKTAIDRRHKLQEEKDQIVSQMIVDGIKVRGKIWLCLVSCFGVSFSVIQ